MFSPRVYISHNEYFVTLTTWCSLTQEATVLDVKKEVHRQDSKLAPHLQRLVYQGTGGSRTVLEDDCK